MNKKILFISSNNPLNPKNGLSAAQHSLFNLLNTFNEIDLFVYTIESNNLTFHQNKFIENQIESNIWTVKFDIILFSPMSSFRKFAKLRRINPNAKTIVQISDSLAYEAWRSFVLSLKFKSPSFQKLLKLPFYYFSELMTVNKSNYSLMQTKKDVQIINLLYFTKKGIRLPNSINQDVGFSCTSNVGNDIGWCSTFQGQYLKLAKWFSKNVIVPFFHINKTVKLQLLGNGSEYFKDYLEKKHPTLRGRINQRSYQKELNQFYSSIRVAICPIFKGYGLINKSIDAMRFGKPVLGDISAFNGIEGVVSGKNCLIANECEKFIYHLEFVFRKENDGLILQIGEEALKTINDQKWHEENKQTFKRLLSI